MYFTLYKPIHYVAGKHTRIQTVIEQYRQLQRNFTQCPKEKADACGTNCSPIGCVSQTL